MKNYKDEYYKRVDFIRHVLTGARADGVVFGNSGGKDSALAGILCKAACDNTIGLIMPCSSKRNYGEDKVDAEVIAAQFNIVSRIIDLTETKDRLINAVGAQSCLTGPAQANIIPRLRMTALYAVAASENRLVAGTGNRSERYMGYFTKWGDGAYDFNPIADLTVTEIYDFLRYLKVPDYIINKVPSAGLFDGQTDEEEMGVTYQAVDNFLLNGMVNDKDRIIIERHNKSSEHKRSKPLVYEA